VAVEFFVGEDGETVAAAVDGDVDGVAEGAHAIRVAPAGWGAACADARSALRIGLVRFRAEESQLWHCHASGWRIGHNEGSLYEPHGQSR
jgi:hypothetical protein